MTPTSFLEHWGIVENPFRAEEARQDSVLARLVAAGGRRGGAGAGLAVGLEGGDGAVASVSASLASRAQHNDYEKVVGDLRRPSSAVVFGEKGSGKTTLRLQIQHAVTLHNQNEPQNKVLLIAHDELTAFLERLHARLVRQTRKGQTTPTDSFKQTRLVDHLDAVLGNVVPRLVDALLENTSGVAGAGGGVGAMSDPSVLDLGPEPRRVARGLDKQTRRDLLILQAVYDRADSAGERLHALRRGIGVRRPVTEFVEWAVARVGWVVPVFTLVWIYQSRRAATGRDYPDGTTGFLGWREWIGLGGTVESSSVAWTTVFFASLLIWLLIVVKRWWVHRLMFNRSTRKVYKQVRVTGRSERSFAASLHELPAGWRGGGALPVNDAEATRLAMVQRLRRVLRAYGYAGMLVVVDRVDEPALIAGDVERMRSVVWPLLSNGYLQQEGLATKLLLPIELRHALLRESAAFFQQARLDKQNVVEQLNWTGPMLYDLCDARLAACRAPGAEAVTLAALFDSGVGREAIVEALETMRQPRDAFKMIYQCISEHCARTVGSVSSSAVGGMAEGEGEKSADGASAFRISKAVFDEVRKAQAERLRQLAMGVRPV
jgi:hypothetical protein